MVLVAAVAGWYLLRRQGLRWGATAEEVHKPLPGDEVLPHPMLETTHAVTIDASAEEIWPWLVQMGHYRAGFYADPSWWDKYSDKYLRSLGRKEAPESGYGFREVPSDERIIPEFQDLKEGDTILDGPPGTAFFTVRLMEPNRTLVLYSAHQVQAEGERECSASTRWGSCAHEGSVRAYLARALPSQHTSEKADEKYERCAGTEADRHRRGDGSFGHGGDPPSGDHGPYRRFLRLDSRCRGGGARRLQSH